MPQPDAKSLYYSPQVRGSAAILDNAWQTPLGILQQRQQQQQQDILLARQQAAQQEKETLERVKSFTPEIGDLWEPDLEQGAQAVAAMRDYVSDNLAKGIDATNAVRHPRENTELNRMMQEASSLVSRSKQQKSYYDDFMKQLGGDKAGYYNTSKGYELAQQYRFAKTPQERANIQLELKRLYNLPAYASDVFKDLKPETNTKINLVKDGSQITEDITTYSPAQMDYATSAIKMLPEFQDALKDEYSQMTEQEQQAVKGFDGLVQSRAEELALGHQKKDIKKRRGLDPVFNANRDFNYKTAKDSKGAEEEQDNATERVKWMEALRTGDVDKAKALLNAKLGGKVVVNARFVDDKKIDVPGGTLSGAQDLYGLKQSPIIELEIAVGDVTDDGGDGKIKTTQTRKRKIDMSKPGWQREINNIYDTLVGEKRKVSPEKFDAAAKKLQLFQEGKDTYQPASAKEAATDDPFADFDQPAADPNDPFADFK